MTELNEKIALERQNKAMLLLDLYERSDMVYFNNYNFAEGNTKETALESIKKIQAKDVKISKVDNDEIKYLSGESYSERIAITCHYKWT